MRLSDGHAMTDTSMVPRKSGEQADGRPPLIDEQLAHQLLGKAQAEGVELLGPDGLLSQITKAVLENGRTLPRRCSGRSGRGRIGRWSSTAGSRGGAWAIMAGCVCWFRCPTGIST